MKQNLLHSAASILGVGIVLGAFAPACGSDVSALCSAKCDCEHCNDYIDEQTCDQLNGEADVAKDYGCDAEFTAWVTCQNNNGVCNQDKASFSASDPGSCSGTQDTKIACTTDASCSMIGLGSATCVSLTCRTKTCAGSQNQSCSKDSDCPSGKDKCETQSTALSTCVKNASAHKNGIQTP